MAEEPRNGATAGREQEPEYVITLVHGTFAPRAPWTQESSLLREVLAEKFGASSTVFAPFRWTGGNSHRARIEGGLKFRKFFREGLEEYPRSKHVIIAHSHGGNVVLYGLRQARRRERRNLGAIVCLASPFIHFQETDVSKTVRRRARALGAGVFLIGGVSFIALCVLALESMSDSASAGAKWPIIAAALFMGLAFVGIVVGWWRLRRRFRPGGAETSRLRRSQMQLLRHLRPLGASPAPLLCVATGRDEARLGLELTNAVARMGGLTLRVISWLSLVAAVVMAGFCIWVIWAAIDYAVHLPPPEQRHDYGGATFVFLYLLAMGVGGVVGSAVSFLINRATSYLAETLLRRSVMGIGWGEFAAESHELVHVHPELRPPGGLACELKVLPMKSPLRSRIVRHSALYQDKDAVDAMAEWIAAVTAVTSDDGRAEDRETWEEASGHFRESPHAESS